MALTHQVSPDLHLSEETYISPVSAPDILDTTMGYEAVRLMGYMTENPGDSTLVTELRNELNIARYRFGNTGPGEVEQVADHLRTYLGVSAAGLDDADLLRAASQRPEDGGVSDQELYDFLSWHVGDVMEQQDSPELDQTVAQEKSDYRAGLLDGVGQGEFHASAIRALPRVAATRVFVGDMWQMHGAADQGYHDHLGDRVVIRQGEGNDPAERRATLAERTQKILIHEMNHLEFDDTSRPRLEREAGVEEVSLCMKDGEYPEVLDPDARRDPGGYYWERKVMHGIDTFGAKRIPARLSRRAVTSEPDSPERALVRQERDNSWGVDDVVATVARYAESLEQAIKGKHKNLAAKEARTRALKETLHMLEEQPGKIFGRRYKKPQPALGATALLTK